MPCLAPTPTSQMSIPCLDLGYLMNGEAVSWDCDLPGGICNAKCGQCEWKPNVLGRRCEHRAAGTYGFGPAGYSLCECGSGGVFSGQLYAVREGSPVAANVDFGTSQNGGKRHASICD